MDRRVRKPQPIHSPPAAVGQGPQYGWSADLREPPVTRSNALTWMIVGAVLTVMVMADVTFVVSLYVVLTDPGARVPVLIALISAVFGLPTTLLTGWRLYERSRNRAHPGRAPRRTRK